MPASKLPITTPFLGFLVRKQIIINTRDTVSPYTPTTICRIERNPTPAVNEESRISSTNSTIVSSCGNTATKPSAFSSTINSSSNINIRQRIAYSVAGTATAGILGIFGVSLTSVLAVTVPSGAFASKMGLTLLIAGLAANPAGASAIAAVAGLAIIAIVGFSLYKGYQAYKTHRNNTKTEPSRQNECNNNRSLTP